MYIITINEYILYGIVVFAGVIFVTIILGFIAYIYHTKRMFDSIDKFNDQTLDKTNTYSKQINEYDKNVKRNGIKRRNMFVFKTKKNVDKFKDSY